MNFSSAAQCFSTIPELVLLVSAHLMPQDLARCMRVCKEWSRMFEASLWTNLCTKIQPDDSLSATPPPPLKAALIRNLHLIRNIRISDANNTLLQVLSTGSVDPSEHCTDLKRLEIEDVDCEDPELSSQHLATLLDLNHHLVRLNIPFEFLASDAALVSISQLERLEHLTIYSSNGLEADQSFLLFLQACLPLPSLKELFLNFELQWESDEWDTQSSILRHFIDQASIARSCRNLTGTKIKSLQLPRNYGIWNPLPLLILKSSLVDLESCEIPWFDGIVDLDEIEHVAREHCFNVRHLICPSFEHMEEDGQSVRAFIRGCRGLQSFASEHFCDLDVERHFDTRYILMELAQQHSQTLKELSLPNSHIVHSQDQQAILARCKHLKRFWVTEWHEVDTSIGIAFTDICLDDWVCMELTELSLILNRYPREQGAFNELEIEVRELNEEERDEAEEKEEKGDIKARLIAYAAKLVYQQIGRLQKLESLALGIDTSEDTCADEDDYAWDLTLSKGWLGELAGLKNLKSLSLQADLSSRMGQAEAEFIHENWPLLNEVTLQGCASPFVQSHWRWLAKTRPQFQIHYTRH